MRQTEVKHRTASEDCAGCIRGRASGKNLGEDWLRQQDSNSPRANLRPAIRRGGLTATRHKGFYEIAPLASLQFPLPAHRGRARRMLLGVEKPPGTGMAFRVKRASELGFVVLGETADKIVRLPDVHLVKGIAQDVHVKAHREKLGGRLAPAAGFEPATKWLTATYSTAELCRNDIHSKQALAAL